jgi:hypothetical protein
MESREDETEEGGESRESERGGMTMTYAELIKKEARIADGKARFDQGLLMSGNCRGTPASASLSVAVGWIGYGPCITGEADSFDDGDLVLEELKAA